MEGIGIGWGWRKLILRLFLPFPLPVHQLGRGVHWKRKVASEGMAGLQATAQPGERRLCSFYVSGGRLLAWFDCVGDSCDFSSGPRCMVYCVLFWFFSLDLGHVSIMVMIVFTLR